MVVLAEVRGWEPAALDAVFAQLGRARDRLLDTDPDLRAARPPTGWSGAAAEAAGREHERVAENTRRTVAAVTALRPSVARAVDTLTQLHRELDGITATAAARGYHMHDDGTVTAPAPLPWLPAHPAATTPAHAQQLQDAELAELTTSLKGVLRRADELDTTLAAALTAAAGGQVDDGTGTALLDAAVHVLGGDRPPPAPPPDATPGQNAAWWASLTPVQREHLLLTDPGLIANRDGLPATVRDQANRTRLDTETARIDADIAATQARIDALPPPPKVRFGGIDQLSERLALGNELAELHDQRDALATVTETIAVDPDNRQLLVLDLDGNDEPRAAVAVGDVSTADHVAVLTPGFTTTVADSLPEVTNDVSALRENAINQLRDDHQPAATVAAVAWIGYDIPQFDTVVSSDRSVFGDDAAHEGGRALDRFLDGIAAARPDHDPHLTALGHSYGSTTTGYALQETTSVDDAVIFGSPGASTGDLTQLNVPPGHLSVIEARGDVVADAGLFGPDPNQLDLTNLSAEAAVAPDGRPLSEATGHSEYLAAGSTSQHNLGATVAGLPGNRIFADDNSGFGDWIRGKAPA